jgi:hypothetical protein
VAENNTMKISGFTFLRNAHKLYYPIKESILSILEIVDEFVVALGEGDENDNSLEILNSINSPKIKIIYTKWDLEKYPGGTEYAHQTDLAKQACSGDWLFYLQGDEVVHEEDLGTIKSACQEYHSDSRIEGFVFNYLHFWGDYDHYFSDHCWYKKEIRIIRNLPEIHSWKDAQSFRFIPDFVGNDYNRKQNTRKLNCVALDARIFHYGWVRPPEVMKNKNDAVMKNYSHTFWKDFSEYFDYGRMDYCKIFKSTHPKVMSERLKELNWSDKLRYDGPVAINRSKMKHERPKYRILSWIEENILVGYVIGGFKNYRLLK